MPLREKILITLTPLLFLQFFILGWIAYERLKSISQQTTFEQMNTLVNQVSLHVKSDLESLSANIELFSNSELLQKYMFADEEDRYGIWQRPLLTLFSSYITAYPDYYEIRVLLPDGYEDTRFTMGDLPNVQEEEGESIYFQEMAQSKHTLDINLYRNPDNQEIAFLAYKKLILRETYKSTLDEPTLRGYLVITKRPEFIEQQTRESRIGKNGWLFFTNDQGIILFHPDEQQAEQALSNDLFERLVQNAKSHTVFKETYQGQMVFFQGVQLHPHLFLFAVLPEKEILSDSQTLGIIVAIITFASIFITGGVFFILMNFLLIRPIRQLDQATKEIASGNLDVHLDITTQDEIGSLASEFNKMASDLKTSHKKLEEINEASSRFVPIQFLHLLNKENIIDVALGNNTQLNMSVLFSDIRAFTTLSEQMSPEENFKFLNSYLSQMGPIIRKYNGFIDKYIGDSIMALFDKGPDDAVLGAIDMSRELAEYNQGRKSAGYPAIQIGIGINTGDLMLGTIGEHNRMEGTVISDAVNLASRIEGMTKMYEASILISEQTFNHLIKPSHYSIRVLDRVKVKGKLESVTVFEVLDGESPELRDKKLKTQNRFEEAITLYGLMKFEEVIQIMKEVLVQCPEDMAAKIYIERCESFLKEGVGEHWTGITELYIK